MIANKKFCCGFGGGSKSLQLKFKEVTLAKTSLALGLLQASANIFSFTRLVTG